MRRAGSAALDLCNVASGRFDGFWEFNLNPWDTAAGVLIVEEAGGRVTDFSGGPFDIASRETLASNGLFTTRCSTSFKTSLPAVAWKNCPVPVAYAKEHKILSGTIDSSGVRVRSVNPVSAVVTIILWLEPTCRTRLLTRKVEKRADHLRLHGRILFLTEDPDLIKKQLAGWDLPWDTKNPAANPKLRDDISTDEITPAHLLLLLRPDARRDSLRGPEMPGRRPHRPQ